MADKKQEATKKEEDRPVAPQDEDLFEDFALKDGEQFLQYFRWSCTAHGWCFCINLLAAVPLLRKQAGVCRGGRHAGGGERSRAAAVGGGLG